MDVSGIFGQVAFAPGSGAPQPSLSMGRQSRNRCPSMVGVPVTSADLRVIADLIEKRKRDEIQAQAQQAQIAEEGKNKAGGRRKTKRAKRHSRGKKHSRR